MLFEAERAVPWCSCAYTFGRAEHCPRGQGFCILRTYGVLHRRPKSPRCVVSEIATEYCIHTIVCDAKGQIRGDHPLHADLGANEQH